MWKAGNVLNRVGSNPPAVLIWDDETDEGIGEARTFEAARMMAAAPAMLAALQNCLASAIARRDAAKVYADKAGNPSKADVQCEIDEIRAAIAAATGSTPDA